MYKTLYRKYRPEKLDDVHGQEIIVQILKNQITTNRLSHAYIFSGPRGTGKTSVAKILAKIINCESLIDYNPCNVCVNCTQINNKETLDIIEIDAASNNGVDEIRELKSKISLIPSVGKYKIYIIDEVHMLTTSAFNALLKTLEEPPAHVIFILATTEVHKIPETILSRCQKFDFKRISNLSIKNRLEQISKSEGIDIELDALNEIAVISDGGLRDAIGLLEQVSNYKLKEIRVNDVHEINGTISQINLEEFIIDIINNNLDKILIKLEEYHNNGKNIVKIIEDVMLFLKNCLLIREIPNFFENDNLSSIYKRISEQITYDYNLNLLNKINEQINDIKKSANPKVLIEVLLINISKNKLNTNKNIEGQLPKENLIKPIVKEKEDDNLDNKESLEKNDNEINLIKKLQDIRICNTLCSANRDKLTAIKSKIKKLITCKNEKECLKIIQVIIDGKIRAASDSNLVFTYETKGLVEYFNQNILEIEKIISDKISEEYKVIAILEEDWEIYKKQYIGKTRCYVYSNEDDELIKNITKTEENNDDLLYVFKDLIEVK